MEDQQVKCDICHRRLKNKHNLARHMSYIHRPTITQYQCSICRKTLNRRDVLSRQTLQIQGIPEKRFLKNETKRKIQKNITIAPQNLGNHQLNAKVNPHLAPSVPFNQTHQENYITIASPEPWTPPPECRVKARLAPSVPFRSPKFKASTKRHRLFLATRDTSPRQE